MRPEDERYFESLEDRLEDAIDLAERARAGGRDPSPDVEIPVAKDMADRVEKVLGIEGVAARVRELEDEMSREEAALALAKDFAEGRVGDYGTRAGKIEGAVRTAVALLTEGVVAAPIEGIDRVELMDDGAGGECVRIFYAGPIRSAGGTAQALSVLVADYVRTLVGVGDYRARGEEVNRYVEEVALYDDETGLQYSPSAAETRYIAEHVPVCLDGEPTGDEEVNSYRDLERVDTNSARGGMCLVLAEGIALKAPKIERYTSDLAEVDWPWLDDLIDGTVGDEGADGDDATDFRDEEADDGEGIGGEDGVAEEAGPPATRPDGQGDTGQAVTVDGPPRAAPTKKYLRDLIAGRPVFGHPSEAGGFRLRYGRARNHGFATAGVHPATMHLVDDFLATGTQIKTERPGKAAGVVPVDTIEGPTVRLANGDVRRVDDPEEALEIRNGVDAILDLGEYLVNYGEFVENNHPLVPASYTVEWWVQEFEAAGAPVQAMADDPHVDLAAPGEVEAIEWALEYDAPLHPDYTYCWHDVSVATFETLAAAAEGAAVEAGDLVLERTEPVRRALEALLVEHRQGETELRVPEWEALVRSLGLTPDRERTWESLPAAARECADGENAVEAVNAVAPFAVRERAPTRVGNRMGRPEKSETRELSPAVHCLFPVGAAGGDQRDMGKAAGHAEAMNDAPGRVEVRVGRRACRDCGEGTWRTSCPDCGGHTEPRYACPDCDRTLSPGEGGRVVCPRCEVEGTSVETRTIDVRQEYRDALERVGERENAFDVLKGVKGLTSANKTPEPIEKGVLRAKHGVSAFKDGTVRYDMTDLPVTAVRPEELSVDAEQFRALGYEADVHGEPLEHDDQLVPLRVQDVVLSDGAAEHLLRTADFVDDLLEQYYGREPFYEVDEREDLVGELVFGMAPHTSAAVVGRIVGFTSAAVGYAHPYFHAAKRRNCFHPDTKVWYEDGAGQWHHECIETLVEDRLEDPREDDVGTLVTELDGDMRVPSVDKDGSAVYKGVTAVSKHPAQDHLVRIETRSGRELFVTPDHSMRRWTPSGIDEVQARTISKGDDLPTPKTVDAEGSVESFDLLAEFLNRDVIPASNLMVRGIGQERLRSLFDMATEGDEYVKPVAERFGLSQSTVYSWVNRDSVPAAVLLELFGREGTLDRVPADVRLGVRRDTADVRRRIEVDEDVARLLGYYASEGFVRREPGEFFQTTICTPEDDVRETLLDTFMRVFDVEGFEENEWKITVSSRLVSAIFVDVLDAGCCAESKRVPDAVMGSPDSVIQSYLAAYFAGDGSAATDRVEVRAQTVSDELVEDLLAALKRFGIIATTYEESRSPETGVVAAFYDDPPVFESNVLKITSENAVRFAEAIGFDLDRKDETLAVAIANTDTRSQRVFGDGGDIWLDEVVEAEVLESNVEYTYSLTVADTHTLVANDLYVGQCDGDEDCVMLLLDGLLNFSEEYLPDKRGGRMDAPLVMSSRIDPAEIDDEAHNVDVAEGYPLEFYEATLEMADPDAVDVPLAGETVGTDAEYAGFAHTHDTADIALGPDLSAYKTLGSMMDKMEAQLELARKLRAVDETDVAERVIEYHFLPDLLGNLRAFASQETRCLDCGEKYRRMPLSADCRECGGDVTLTVHQGSVNKYMDVSIRVAEEYGAREYTKQRLRLLKESLSSVFENDKNKQSGIADFM